MEYVNLAIGENIRRLRNNRQMTLQDLADVSNVSKSMLGQIERGEANPTISSIWRVANGLKVSFATLISMPKAVEGVIDKADVTVLRSDDGLLENIPFFPFSPDRNFEMFSISLGVGGFLDGSDHPPMTQEYIIVFSGVLTVEIDGQSHHIGRQQAYQFLADIPHRYINIGEEEAQFALVLFYNHKT